MSTVNNWMILSGTLLDVEGEDDALPACIIALNQCIVEHLGFTEGKGFTRVDQYAGGNKALEADVFLFAESHGIDPSLMIALITRVAWGDNFIQIFFKGEEEHCWRQVARLVPMEEIKDWIPEEDLPQN